LAFSKRKGLTKFGKNIYELVKLILAFVVTVNKHLIQISIVNL